MYEGRRAADRFLFVCDDPVGARDLITLLEEAYTRGLYLSTFRAFPDLSALLPKVLRDAYEKNPTAVAQTGSEYLELCWDLLVFFLSEHVK